MQNDISSSSVQPPEGGLGLSQFLNIQKQQGSSVVLGNLLTLPVGGGLLYVEPIYVQANTQSAYPLNRAIITAFGDKLAWSSTLDGALDALFGGNSGAKSGDNTPTTGGTGTTPTTPADGHRADGGQPGPDQGPVRRPAGGQRRGRGAQGRRLHEVRRGADPAQGGHRRGGGRGPHGERDTDARGDPDHHRDGDPERNAHRLSPSAADRARPVGRALSARDDPRGSARGLRNQLAALSTACG